MSTKQNPKIFGEDIVDLAVEAAGVGATAVVNDKLVAPIVSRFIAFTPDSPQAKVADAGSTMGAALVGGAIVGMISKRYGYLVKKGGMLLGAAKGVSIIVPGFSLTGNIPALGNLPWPTLPAPQPAPTNGTNGTNALHAPSISGMGV